MSNVRIGEIGAANHVDIESDVRKVSPPTSRTSTIVNDVADPECNSRKRLREHESEKFDPCIDKQILVRYRTQKSSPYTHIRLKFFFVDVNT